MNRGLKTGSAFGVPTSPGNLATGSRTEQYWYDPNFDYLTSANYYDNLPNSNPSWSYDAAGNRTDSLVDNLNRTTSIGGVATGCDIYGNRTSLGSSINYSWDLLNRLSQLVSGSTTTNYEYRADGIRTHKASGSNYTEYYHDGQMPIQDVSWNGTQFTTTRYGLGARGMDYMEVGTGATRPTTFPTVSFPLYDAHGNVIETISRSGNSYLPSTYRTYDAWGQIRQGAPNGDPANRYCGNLGHQHDDESGLIYMRARYYEPGSGRFISEDQGQDGTNYFVYVKNSPLRLVDRSGCEGEEGVAGEGLVGSLCQTLEGYVISGATWISTQAGRQILTLSITFLSRTNIATNLEKFIEELEEIALKNGCEGVEVQWTSQTPKGAAWAQRLIEMIWENQGFHITSDGLVDQLYWLLDTM